MGCIVNGPGESKHADIGISLPGTGEAPAAPVFIDGKKAMTLRGPNIAAEFKAIVEEYVAQALWRQGVGRNSEAYCAICASPVHRRNTADAYCALLHQPGAAVEDRVWQLAGARFWALCCAPFRCVNRHKQDK